MTKEELIAFEADIACEFNAAKIRAPVHLAGGNEDELIEYFAKNFNSGDWVCTTWRSHYHCLLAGVPPELVKSEIMAGRSITLCLSDYRVISSAIVGGILPIALGLAWSINRTGKPFEKVHVFVGDMAQRSGIFSECYEYALGHNLPIQFIVEDNKKSVGTDTAATWGEHKPLVPVKWIEYKLPWPHSGAGKRVEF